MIGAVCQAGQSESLRSQNEGGYLGAGHWQLTVSYRKQYSHRHFVGKEEQKIREEQGTQVVNDIHLMDFSLSYQVNPRWSVNVSTPVMFATRIYDSKLFQVFRHQPNAPTQTFHTAGIGDMVVSAQTWLWRPPTESNQNIAISFGLKMPTGPYGQKYTVPSVNGPVTQTIDQSIQLGDGGWGFTTGMQAFKAVKRSVLFLSGTYLFNPRDTNGVQTGRRRASEAIMSVPDQYLAEAGVAYPFPKVRGLAVDFGTRVEGIPATDIIGKSNGFRRPGYIWSLSPGFEYSRGRNIWVFSIPVPIQRDRIRSVPDILDGTHGDAGFADYLILLSYTRRF